MKTPTSFFLAGLCLLTWAPTAIPGKPVTANVIDGVMKEAIKSWQVPGAAIAVIKDGHLYMKGFGVRELGKPAPVTPDTVFPIASCTKPFTTLAMAMLIDEGKMAWDDPVRKHVEFFHLSDPLADAQATLRDLVTHRTGVGGNDLLWYRAPWSLEERIRKVGRLPLESPFRTELQYQSILFGTAGFALGRASGSTWADFVRRRILLPLDMKRTTFTSAEGLQTQDHASPHRKNSRGKLEVLPWYKITEPDPAGSINSSVRDLAQFIRFQLGDGDWPGGRLVSRQNLAETHRPQIVLQPNPFARAMNPHTNFLCYGLGWVVQDYRGQMLIMHGGSIDGFRAHFTLVPRTRLGFVILNNLHETQMNMAVSNTLVDLFLNLPYKDWNAYFQELERTEEAETKARLKKTRESRKPNTKPSRELAAYVGTYEDPAYGTARVSLDKNSLILHWSSFHWPLKHFHFDTFLANEDMVILEEPVTFALDPDGEVASLRTLGRDFHRKQEK